MIILAFLRVFHFTQPLKKKKKKPVSVWLRHGPGEAGYGASMSLFLCPIFNGIVGSILK